MRYIFILVTAGTINLSKASAALPNLASSLFTEVQHHSGFRKPVSISVTGSRLYRRDRPRETPKICEGTLQKRGQCLAKPPGYRRQAAARSHRQSQSSIGPDPEIGSPQNQRMQQSRATNSMSPSGSALVGGKSDRQHPSPSLTSSPYTPMSNSRISKGRPKSSSPDSAHSSQTVRRLNFLNTGATGMSTMTQTELDSVSSGQLSIGQASRQPRAPTAKVKIRGPGIIEVDNLQGNPRSTRVETGERAHDGMRNSAGVSSLAYTDPGGKSRSRAKGEMVTAKVHKHGIGTARVRIKDLRGTTEETIDHGTFGTRTFTASSDDPGNPASIKVKAAGSIYTSLSAQNKPIE